MGVRMLIGAGAGYSGERLDAPLSVVRDLRTSGERAAIIIFETLGERTLAAAQLPATRVTVASSHSSPMRRSCFRCCARR
jgi:hypothetical protein